VSVIDSWCSLAVCLVGMIVSDWSVAAADEYSVMLLVCVAVPHSNMYIVISPVCAMIDYLTIEWLNEFLLDLAKRAVSLAVNINSYDFTT